MEYENLNARGFDTPHNELEKGVENNETMKRISNGFYVSKNFHRFIQQNKILSTTLTLHLFLIVLYVRLPPLSTKSPSTRSTPSCRTSCCT